MTKKGTESVRRHDYLCNVEKGSDVIRIREAEFGSI
mgnify:CR=1 FL=1